MQKNTFIFVGLTLLLVVVALLDLCCGSAYWISPDGLFALFSEDLSSIADSPSPIANILLHIRLPKMLTAIPIPALMTPPPIPTPATMMTSAPMR